MGHRLSLDNPHNVTAIVEPRRTGSHLPREVECVKLKDPLTTVADGALAVFAEVWARAMQLKEQLEPKQLEFCISRFLLLLH